MRVLLARLSTLSVCVLAVSAEPARGQSPGLTSEPRLVRVTGALRPARGRAPAPIETMTLSIYGEKTGGVRLWQETQTVAVNPDGRFTLLLGSTRPEGVPLDLFASDEPRWLAVHVDHLKREPGRVLLPTSAAATNTAVDAGALQRADSGGFTIKIFGTAKLDFMYNTARTQGPGLPAFLVPSFAGGFKQTTIAINARNSSIGLLFTGPDIGKFHSGGKLSAVFFDNTNVFADNNGFMLTQAYGELFNEKWRFAAGLQLDVFAPNLPTVLPFSADGAPVGNTIKGQIRVERFVDLASGSQWNFQGALSEPLNSIKTPDISVDEDNGWPNVEGRIAFGGGKPAPIGIGLLTQRPLEVAVSGVVGQLRRTAPPDQPPPRRVVSDVWGAAVDYRVNFKGFFGFKGEAYAGQALGQSAGAVLQSLDAVTWKAIRSSGGWVEGFVYLTPNVHSHTGIMLDYPNDDDITPVPNSLFGRTYNRVFYSTLIWDLTKTFRIGLEPTWRRTEYKEPTSLPNEGFGFQTQFAWTFGT